VVEEDDEVEINGNKNDVVLKFILTNFNPSWPT
jgi:hypothetical protein